MFSFFSAFSYSICCIIWCVGTTSGIKALGYFKVISMLCGCGIARSLFGLDQQWGRFDCTVERIWRRCNFCQREVWDWHICQGGDLLYFVSLCNPTLVKNGICFHRFAYKMDLILRNIFISSSSSLGLFVVLTNCLDIYFLAQFIWKFICSPKFVILFY